MQDHKQRFFELALAKGNLRFGEFTLKSGRVSPYFFNAGGFDDGRSLAGLAECYADAIVASGVAFDMLFGPAYKGIPLAASIAVALAVKHQCNVPFCYNRKEVKDHGEGGQLVGAPLSGAVLITDDVISAGTSVRESIGWIRAAGAQPAGVAIALDRQERGQGTLSAAREVEQEFGIPVVAIAGLDDLVRFLEHKLGNGDYLKENKDIGENLDMEAIQAYRSRYAG